MPSEVPYTTETWRPLAAEDIATVWELETVGEAYDDGVVEVDLSDIEAEWRQPDFDPSSMSVGVFTNHRLVAYAQVFQGRAEALVHPEHRGRGIGSDELEKVFELHGILTQMLLKLGRELLFAQDLPPHRLQPRRVANG